jgi:hypothetical protein
MIACSLSVAHRDCRCVAEDVPPVGWAKVTNFNWFKLDYALPETMAPDTELLPETVRQLLGRRVDVYGAMVTGRDGMETTFFLVPTAAQVNTSGRVPTTISIVVRMNDMQAVEKLAGRVVAKGILSVESKKDEETGRYYWNYVLAADTCHLDGKKPPR